ncbi:MAG: glycosyltransferase family 2 protein [Acidimicrobiales bacterium]|nr:glycosyltransferase family 2 protein [Hyphomonadaceae bacterium]RZV44128.1 MAG: glycosyltransferase family 2 protein [Acidimicrobiales bacterium]
MESQISKVSVIIVNYNAGDWLAKSTRSLLSQMEADFECFIVDNGSTDGSLGTLPKLDKRFTIIELGYNAGFAVANNHAAKLANSPWIALLNPDAFARPDWLEKLLAETTIAPNIAMVGSTQYLALADTPTLDGAGDCYHFSGIAYRAGYGHNSMPPATGFVFGPCAAAALYDREKFLELGGFDERFFCYHEDVDLAFRMQLTGFDCIQSQAAIVDHVSSAIASKVPNFAIYHGTRNRIWTFFKNMPAALLILLLPVHILANLAYLYWALFRKDRFGPTLQGVKDAMVGLPEIMETRRKVQNTRKISMLALLSKFTWSPIKVLRRGIHIRKIP